MSVPNLTVPYILLCGLVLGGCEKAVPVNSSPVANSIVSGYLQHERLVEASGITVSRRNPEVLWLINDNGNEAVLYATARDGSSLAEIPVEGATNVDWEDLASFTLDGQPWLLIADIGDNDAVHEDRVLYVLAEPSLDGELPATIKPSWEIRYRYPGGARDSEAAAVDASNETVFVLSKRTQPAELFALPLRPTPVEQPLEATLLGPVSGLPLATDEDIEASQNSDPETFVWHWQPTAMDISTDNQAAVILTYRNSYYWKRETNDSWYETLSRQALALDIAILPDAEAIAFANPGQLLVTSEGYHAAIQQITITPTLH